MDQPVSQASVSLFWEILLWLQIKFAVQSNNVVKWNINHNDFLSTDIWKCNVLPPCLWISFSQRESHKEKFYVFRPRRTNRVVKLVSQQIPNKVFFNIFISIHGTFLMYVMSFHFNDAYKDLWMRNQGQIQRRVDQTLILNSILKIHDIYIYHTLGWQIELQHLTGIYLSTSFKQIMRPLSLTNITSMFI